jgi:FtsH-binding integral membrane protein
MSEDVLISPEAARPRYDARLVSRAAAADVVSVLLFALIGRASHDEGMTASGLLTTAWPFVVGVAGGWVGVFLARFAPLSYPAATMMLVKTLILGCVLRVIFTDGAVPLSFVIVAAVFLGAMFFGWRATARVLSSRSSRSSRDGSPTPAST